jgi:hypothetical protein
MADTFGDLKSLVADDIMRSDLTSQIETEVLGAVSHFQNERFYFNEDRSVSFTTVNAQEFYSTSDNSNIPNYLEFDSIVLTANGSRYSLRRTTYDELEDKSTISTATGQPFEYAYYNQQLRLYPIPNSTYGCRVSGVLRFTALSAAGDTNAWTRGADARDLIRWEAERRIYSAIIKSDEDAARCAANAMYELDRLRSETTRRMSSGRTRPTVW